MIKPFQPMLAAKCAPEDVDQLRYPGLISPKLDGIRAVVSGGVLLSRKLKPIPSRILQKRWGKPEFEGLDGEIMTGPTTAPDVFRRTTSAVMTVDGDEIELGLTFFHVFDDVRAILVGYQYRRPNIHENGVVTVPTMSVVDSDEMLSWEKLWVAQGYEGVMWRDPAGPYKFGRSTMKEQYLVKIKRFADMEYLVEGFEEKMHNANKLQTDERGYAKRTSHQENKQPMDTLGAIKALGLTGPFQDVRFSVGTGFDDLTRKYIWEHREDFLGTIRKCSYFPSGSKDAPRFPVDLGERKD